ncbi:fam-b protein [Plasmodium vinckei brucechwatti]|uniref:Fam-b protein n=1 Tax=Plasmodium vinckei brucechwatti TaxID=119398 RepID=A0A6V7SKI1_PLAVN|nr:fam-b protein [Plasmodium vinckei brucechwatti]
MKVSIFKFVFFPFIICFFEYAKKELYFINGGNIYLERNIINFKNNRILADAGKEFDLNYFYESTLSLANQFSDYIDNDEKIKNLRNTIDSRIKKHKRSNISPNLNNIDEKTKNLIYELQKELEEVKKELDNIRNGKIQTQPIQNKRIIINDENISVSEHESFSQLKNGGNLLDRKHNEVVSSSKNKLKKKKNNNNNKDVFDDEANFKHIRSKKFKNPPYRYTNYYESFDSYDNPYYSYNGYPPHDVCDSL